jgi:serine/threonine protein kinase
MAEAAKEFLGTKRFSVSRKLGAGRMGVVYEAVDQLTKKTVALKTLSRTEPEHIYRLKREFRELADVSHPNLAALYELMSEGRHWFFTMELVRGVTFTQYVRPQLEHSFYGDSTIVRDSESVPSEADTVEFDSSRLIYDSAEVASSAEAPPICFYELDESRLRPALRQLAEGVHHLHELGKLHRDIKPSNVLVTGEGRVVILDFGLVEDVEPAARDTLLVGTPDYMSPEQGAQLPVSPPSDWYSVGVILYEALTGRLPFTGKVVRGRPAKANKTTGSAAGNQSTSTTGSKRPVHESAAAEPEKPSTRPRRGAHAHSRPHSLFRTDANKTDT